MLSAYQIKEIEAGPYTRERTVALTQDIKELRAALTEALATIKALHGPIAWDIYEQNAPEMKRLRAALSS